MSEKNPAVDLRDDISETILEELEEIGAKLREKQRKWDREQDGIDYYEKLVESALDRQTQLSVELDELYKKRADLKRNLKSVL